MRYLLIGLKSLFVFLLIPVVLGVYLEKRRTLQGTALQKLLTKNPLGVLLLLFVGGGIFLEVWFFPRDQLGEQRPLVFLELEEYQKELDSYNKTHKSSNWTAEEPQLIRKFKHVLYAWSKADYQETINTLYQLHNAKDSYGRLLQIESYTVLNNLGVAYFKLQRNKEFKASGYLKQALVLAESKSVDTQLLVNNIKALDVMVNQID